MVKAEDLHEEKRLPHGMHRAKEKKSASSYRRPPACQTDRQMCKATPSYSSCLYFILGQCISRKINPKALSVVIFSLILPIDTRGANYKCVAKLFDHYFKNSRGDRYNPQKLPRDLRGIVLYKNIGMREKSCKILGTPGKVRAFFKKKSRVFQP